MNKNFFAGKKVLVMGLGRFGGGADTAAFAHQAGAKVIVTDLACQDDLSDSFAQLQQLPNIKFRLGCHDQADFEQADIVVVNPAIHWDNEYVKLALHKNKVVTTQVNIFFELCPARIIGITGSNGKSTTSALTAHLLKSQIGREGFDYSNVWLSGNIGNKPLLSALDQIHKNHLVVLELSSFQAKQLSAIEKAPQISLLTNLTPNHLDWHKTFDDYCAAKENIFRFQDCNTNNPAVSIFNSEDKIAAEWLEKYKDDKSRVCKTFSTLDLTKKIRSSFNLPGNANLSNLAAAVSIAGHFKISDKRICDALSLFKGLPHRLQLVEQIRDVCWYNDSVSTTPESTIAALDAFTCPRILIAGGYDKKLSFDQLGKEIADKSKLAILVGQTAEKITDSIRKHSHATDKIHIVNSLAEAVHTANKLAVAGDVVLFSPGCPSYDMFDNFQQRGSEFISLARSMCR